jgi:hypothetical protein
MTHDHKNQGVLFRNHRKEADRHADYTGSANIDGLAFWINAWCNESKAGVKYLSLRFKPKQPANVGVNNATISRDLQNATKSVAKSNTAPVVPNVDDDFPW